jgi:hypothetical protein
MAIGKIAIGKWQVLVRIRPSGGDRFLVFGFWYLVFGWFLVFGRRNKLIDSNTGSQHDELSAARRDRKLADSGGEWSEAGRVGRIQQERLAPEGRHQQ